MKGFLTTHVLDTSRGIPAANLKIDLYRIVTEGRIHICSAITNIDGRTENPVLPSDKFQTGKYELVFHAGKYLEANGVVTLQTIFLDEVPIQFIMTEYSHYHVPLLLSPYGYSTYRGS